MSSSNTQQARGIPNNTPTSNAFMVVPAEAREVFLRIQTNQDGLRMQIEELIEAKNLLINSMQKVDQVIDVQFGDILMGERFHRGKKDDKLKSNAITVKIVFEMPKDVFEHTKRLVEMLEIINVPNKREYFFTLDFINNSMIDAEKYRPDLQKIAFEEIRKLKDFFNNFQIRIEDLEKPLDVSKKNEMEFIISLPYIITIESRLDKGESPKEEEKN